MGQVVLSAAPATASAVVLAHMRRAGIAAGALIRGERFQSIITIERRATCEDVILNSGDLRRRAGGSIVD
jgi:hypothetical protein